LSAEQAFADSSRKLIDSPPSFPKVSGKAHREPGVVSNFDRAPPPLLQMNRAIVVFLGLAG
jgi:hypothetical protein